MIQKKRADFYRDGVLYQRGLYGSNIEGSVVYYTDGMGRFSGSLKFDKNGSLIKKRLIEYTDNSQIVKNFSIHDFDTIDNEMIKYFDGSNDYKKYYPSGNINYLMKNDLNGRVVLHETWFENGEKEETSVFTYNTDGSYVVNSHNYIDESDSIIYYDKNKKTINGPEGYSGIGYGFDENNIKRKVVLKADENGELSSLSNLSGKIVLVADIMQDSPAEKLGVQQGDLILMWGNYNYFPLGSETELFNSVEKGKTENSTILFYRPSDSSLYSLTFEPGTKGIVFTTKYAGNSIEESERYIQDLHKTYAKWKKKNK